jgi:hypothetical protein
MSCYKQQNSVNWQLVTSHLCEAIILKCLLHIKQIVQTKNYLKLN